MSPAGALLVAGAGFVAGAVNAIAGGGSLVSFPALVAVGFPPLAANVTNSVAMWPGYASSIPGFRDDLAGQRTRLVALSGSAAAGGLVGVALLLALPSDVFDAAVPWCVLAASALLAGQSRLSAWLRRRGQRAGRAEGTHPLALHAMLFAAGAYGAYFGGGLGVVLLGVLGLYLADHLHTLIGMKNVLSLLVSTVAVASFVLLAPIAWSGFAVLAPAAFAGGFAGARLAKLVPPAALRWTIVLTGVAVGVAMLLT